MMIYLTLVGVLFSVAAASDSVGEPMVAFMCNRPAMHWTKRGWTKDDDTNCLKDSADILNYCRKMYPKLDVWNIVEASESSTIKNWCNFGRSRCHNKFSVRPYRCLIGSFESEALEVPEHCQFDHVHSAEQCKSYAAWNETTAELCAKRRMHLRGFSILQPCAIDEFSGAEYVCCPTEQEGVTGKGKELTEKMTSSSIATTKRGMTSQPSTTSTASFSSPTASSVAAATESDYLRYLRNPVDPSLSEHEYYLHAKADLDKRHHEKVTKMMKEWASARHRVQEIKKSDVKGGEKFNREMTARFQKAYDTLEREGAQQKKQLSAVHQQRVQTELNKKKRLAMDAYLDALRDDEPDATAVLKSLMHYIKTEQKDRIHTINHYQHIQESDPVEAESIRSDIADHLRGTDQRVTEAIDMLGRLPKYEKKIRTQIEKFLSSYQSLDESLSVIMTKINEQSIAGKKMVKKPEPVTDIKSIQEVVSTKEDGIVSANEHLVSTSTAGATTISTSTLATSIQEDQSSTDGQSMLSTPHSIVQTSTAVKESVADEKEHPVVEVKPAEHVAYVAKNDLVVLENYIKKRPVKAEAGLNVAAPLGIAIGGIAVFVAIVVGIAFLRRRVAGAPTRQSVTEIDRRATAAAAAARPEADAAAAAEKKAPQINGYENPTYQYYAANA